MTGNLNSFFFKKNKTNKYPCSPSRLLCKRLLGTNRYSVAQATPRTQGLAKTSVKTNNSSSAFPGGVAESNRSDEQEKRWEIGEKHWKIGGKNVSTSVRPPRDNARGFFQQRNFSFSSGILWRLQLSGVGGRKPQEVAGSLW